jgi:hypothetical protein
MTATTEPIRWLNCGTAEAVIARLADSGAASVVVDAVTVKLREKTARAVVFPR